MLRRQCGYANIYIIYMYEFEYWVCICYTWDRINSSLFIRYRWTKQRVREREKNHTFIWLNIVVRSFVLMYQFVYVCVCAWPVYIDVIRITETGLVELIVLAGPHVFLYLYMPNANPIRLFLVVAVVVGWPLGCLAACCSFHFITEDRKYSPMEIYSNDFRSFSFDHKLLLRI